MSLQSGELSGEYGAIAALPPLVRRRSAALRSRRRGEAARGRQGVTPARWAAAEVRALFALATPLALAGLVSMGISITDVAMMGSLGAGALAAGAAASDLYSIFFYLGAGVLQAVSPLVARARGGGRPEEVRQIFGQGLWAAVAVAAPGCWLVWSSGTLLDAVGVAPEIAAGGHSYARMMALAFVPMTGVMLLRQTLAACGRPRAFLWAMVAALPVNALGNWILMHGRFGAPRLGLAGIGLSSALVATLLFAILAATVAFDPHLRRYRLLRDGVPLPRPSRLREIFRVGAPIGLGNLGEMGVFLFSTVLLGRLGVEVLAGHAVAMRTAGVLYALPMGLAQAATVRLALAAGAGDREGVARSARVALASASLVGVVFAGGLLLLRAPVAGALLSGGAGASSAALFLLVLALMQPVEVVATTAAGALRGLCDTRVPMLVLLAGHWGVGFSTGIALAFWLGLGGLGTWIGLASGSSVVALVLAARLWRKAVRQWAEGSRQTADGTRR
jgi:MATE family multidrug resistance protein